MAFSFCTSSSFRICNTVRDTQLAKSKEFKCWHGSCFIYMQNEREGRAMSVLTEIMNERAAWDKQELRLARRMRNIRVLLEYALLATIGFVVYCYHAQLLEIAKSVFE